MTWNDRPSALLTPRQREILRDEGEDIGERAKRTARARIRDRLKASVLDLELIVQALPLKDLDKALAEPEGHEHDVVPPVANAITALPMLLYLYNRERELGAEDYVDGWVTARDVAAGICDALTRLGVSYDYVDVEIEIERTEDLVELAEQDISELSDHHLTQLHRAGLISNDEFARTWLEKTESE